MHTKVYRVTEEEKNRVLNEAAQIIRRGGLLAIPTETVYGLGANALDKEAVRKIFEAKGRPQDNPLLIHIPDASWLEIYCEKIPPLAYRLAEAFWPGPLTMILKCKSCIPYETTGGLETVGVRCPDNAVTAEIIRLAGVPVAAPSANRSGHPSCTSAETVLDDFAGRIEGVVDDGPCRVGVESTILDMTEYPPKLLRPGGLSLEDIRRIIPETEMDAGICRQLREGEQPKAPGMKYRHYAPKADLQIVEGPMEQVISYINEQCAAPGKTGVICTEETREHYHAGDVKCIGSRRDELSIASHLFAILREFDEDQVDRIYSESFDTPGIGQAVMNRLLKAAGHRKIDVS